MHEIYEQNQNQWKQSYTCNIYNIGAQPETELDLYVRKSYFHKKKPSIMLLLQWSYFLPSM